MSLIRRAAAAVLGPEVEAPVSLPADSVPAGVVLRRGRLIPWIGGLLANDLLGFQLDSHRSHFLRCAQALLSAEIDWEAGTARLEGHTCHVRSFPISTDVDAFEKAALASTEGVERLRERYCPPGGQLGIGVDRMDYSKGLPEKLKALDFLFERYPEYRGKFTFVQVGVPSRTDIEAYDDLTRKVDGLVWEINDRYGTADWQPVHLIKQSLPAERLAALYRAADLCVVASLRDGMNLVAKEFVASQTDGRGVLLLSKFAGASEELEDATEVNPYDPEDFSRLLRDALALPAEERAARMARMRGSLRTIFDWMSDIFAEWGGIQGGAALPSELEEPLPEASADDADR